VVTGLLKFLDRDANVIEEAVHTGPPRSEVGSRGLESRHLVTVHILVGTDAESFEMRQALAELCITVGVVRLKGGEVGNRGERLQIHRRGLQIGDTSREIVHGGRARSF
jgi:hypothetical protein